ncbi:hypothetical protein K4K53_003506 [Colletotrichum sp. SAR 10_77]|nr:hypothetical protein K4K53_003506 [Colletotrichum sp. SAR 10_77]
MLPLSLASTYREYKRDTDVLASWLALTARSHGYKGDVASAGNEAGDGSKAETQTVKGDDTGKGNDNGRPSKYKVAIRNFVPLAESIASTKPAISTPPSIVNTINRVITARSDFASKVKDFSGLDAHAVEAHAYFVGIIEKVQDILVTKDVAKTRRLGVSSDEETTNLFAALDFKDPSIDFLDAPDIDKPMSKAAPAPPASHASRYEAETSDELKALDAIIIFALMASDLARVRVVIIDTWGRNAREELTLSATALTTSAAVDLANHAVKDVLPIFEAQGGVWEVAQQFVALVCAKNGVDSETLSYSQGTTLMSEHMYTTYDRSLLCQSWPVEDEILRGIQEMKATGSVPFYLVLTAQIHVDIQQNLGILTMNPSQKMVEELNSMKADLNHEMSGKTDFERSLAVATQPSMWPVARDRITRAMIEMMDKLLKDPCHQAKLLISGIPPQQVAEASFFRDSPYMSGLVVAYCRNYMKEAGIDLANFWATFVSTAHVYNALKQLGLLREPWRDLEIALSGAGLESKLFTGPPPTDGKDFYRKYSLQLGFSAVNFANLHKKAGKANTDAAGTKIAPQAEKRLIQHEHVASTFTSLVSKYSYDGSTMEWTELLVRNIAGSTTRHGETVFGNHGANHFKKIASKVQGKEEAKSRPKPNDENETEAGNRLSPWNTAIQLRMALQEESVEFEFPYLEFHRSARSTMEVIKGIVIEALKEFLSPGLAEEDVEMQLAVQLLFKSCDADAKEYDAPLVSVYQQYKEDTDSVASWLASTAKACGYPADLLNPVGQAKKKAKHKHKNISSKYIVALKDFVPLAQFIAGSKKPVVDVPESFVTTINRVINVRSSFSNRLAEHGKKTAFQVEKSHSFFVGILEQVRESLRPRMPTATAAWAESSSSSSADALVNAFEALKVYEPSDDFLKAPDIKRPEPEKATDKVVYEAEGAAYSEFEDAMFAYSVMLEDLRKIRAQILFIWQNYRDGAFDVATAAIATNTAIELAHNVAEEVIPLFRSHGGVWQVAMNYYHAAALASGFSKESMNISDGGRDNRTAFNVKTYDVANNTYVNVYRFLEGFQAVLRPNMLPLFKQGVFGTYDPTSNFKTKSPEEKFQEDQVIMMEVFGELMTIIRTVPNWPVEDEFLRGMREMEDTKKIPFYLVFAAQTYLDIHHILRDDVERGFFQMSDETNIMRNNLNSHLEFHQSLKIDGWTAKHDRALKDTESVIEWLGTDPIHQVKNDYARRQGIPLSPDTKQYYLLRQSPVMSGLILHYFRLDLYDIGIAAANAWGSITYMEHLYNAVEKEGLLGGPWEDMDFMRILVGQDAFYVGEAPSVPEDYYKKFCLQMGVSAATLADRSKRRAKVALESRAGPRGIKMGAPVSVMFQNRFTRRAPGMVWTTELVDSVLSRSEWEEENDGDQILSMSRVIDPKRLSEIRKGKNKKLAEDGGRLPPEKLIRSLLFALQSEIMEVAFPYLLMHRLDSRGDEQFR